MFLPQIKYIYFGVSLAVIACQSSTTEHSKWDSLQKDVFFLAHDSLEGRKIGSKGERKAGIYIVKKLRLAGLIPSGTSGFYQPFIAPIAKNPHILPKKKEKNDSTLVGHNIIGMIDNINSNIIVIGAHYDHLGYGGDKSLYRGKDSLVHNGADDNASGVASIIWLAHMLKKENLSNDLLFIAFSGEENGLWGSNYFCKNPTIDLSKVRAMINLDMVGRMNEQNKLAIHGMGTSPLWDSIVHLANTDSLNLVLQLSGIGPSDHTSFYLQNIPVLHFFTGQHEDYHKPEDDADKINYIGMRKIVAFIKRIVIALDKEEKMTFKKTKDESQDVPRFSVTLGVMPNYLFTGKGMQIDGISEDKVAQRAGIKKGDIVVKMGELEVIDMKSYMNALSSFKKGDKTEVTVNRKGKEVVFLVIF